MNSTLMNLQFCCFDIVPTGSHNIEKRKDNNRLFFFLQNMYKLIFSLKHVHDLSYKRNIFMLIGFIDIYINIISGKMGMI